LNVLLQLTGKLKKKQLGKSSLSVTKSKCKMEAILLCHLAQSL